MDRAATEAEVAEEKLRHWEGDARDDAVRAAASAGMSTGHIQKVSGLAATTIMRILNQPRTSRA